MDKEKERKIFSKRVIWSFVVFCALAVGGDAYAASLYIGPANGSYSVGDTFSVSLYLNSEDAFINAVEAKLQFPPDKLQVVSATGERTSGKSFIEIWVGQPQYSNVSGTISFTGAVPSPGVKTSQGLISTVTFRVKSTGKAVLSYLDDSRVLLNDGRGTDVLANTSGAIYELTLPPPAGPIVISPTHPDQSRWYPSDDVIFEWAAEDGVEGYSYVLDSEPVTIPDNIVDENKNNISYSNVGNGIKYFHIKTIKGGVWGGVTHYAVNSDINPPAKFGILIEPGRYTTQHKPVFHFSTTDADSGISHYELKIISLSEYLIESAPISGTPFFIEASSPYIGEYPEGKYDVIVRAYDEAGNFQEITERLRIIPAHLAFVVWPSSMWFWILLLLFLIFAFSVYLVHRYRKLHKDAHETHQDGPLTQEAIANKIKELQEMQKRFNQITKSGVVILLVTLNLLGTISVSAAGKDATLSSPIVTTYLEHTTNDELFYVGGTHPVVGSKVKVFIQNIETGERSSFDTLVDERGNWFYAHNSFLSPGNYQMWSQAENQQISSAPSAEYRFNVEPAVLRLGSSRISFETIYLVTAIFLLIATSYLISVAFVHKRIAKRKNILLIKEIQDVEESLRAGFSTLKSDIEKEIALMREIKKQRTLNDKEAAIETQLKEDLERIEKQIGKEVWDLRSNI